MATRFSNPAGTRISVLSGRFDPAAHEKLVSKVVAHKSVAKELKGRRYRVLGVETLAPPEKDEKSEAGERRVLIFDYTENRLLEVRSADGGVDQVRALKRQPLPSDEEWREALALVSRHPELGPQIASGELQPYRPMPPLAEEPNAAGEIERALHVGLRPKRRARRRHQIVRANLVRNEVQFYDGGAPRGSTATDSLCGAPEAAACQTIARGTPGTLNISWPPADPLWTMTVIRPSASSGTRGSGIELRYVNYLGKRILYQAHVPILNVQYDGDLCGPYRDWQYDEWCFQANGVDVAPGFRWCDTPPQTICESGTDGGNFQGVAIYERGNSLVLVTQLMAGWYRYIQEWSFDRAGIIRARMRFGATADSCVCNIHHHHAYWRLDFDLAGIPNVVEEYNDPPLFPPDNWHLKKYEIKRPRDAAHDRMWRVRNRKSGEAYEIAPGPNDGIADAFGRGDFWVVRYRGPAEIDDGYNITTGPGAPAEIDKFVNGEDIVDQDVVVWYGAHFTHHIEEGEAFECHEIGPDLNPGSCAVWEAATSGNLLSRVDALRAFRDTAMAQSEAGRRYTKLIRKHSPEVVALMAKNRKVRSAAVDALKAAAGFLPEAGKEAKRIDAKSIAVVGKLLDLLDASGSDALKEDVAAARRDLPQFEKQNASAALAAISRR